MAPTVTRDGAGGGQCQAETEGPPLRLAPGVLRRATLSRVPSWVPRAVEATPPQGELCGPPWQLCCCCRLPDVCAPFQWPLGPPAESCREVPAPAAPSVPCTCRQDAICVSRGAWGSLAWMGLQEYQPPPPGAAASVTPSPSLGLLGLVGLDRNINCTPPVGLMSRDGHKRH